MKREYSTFDWVSLIGITSVFVVMFTSIAMREYPDWGRISIFGGVWLIIGFFIVTHMIGILNGVHRTKIKIPKVPTAIVFLLATGLFLNGVYLGGQI